MFDKTYDEMISNRKFNIGDKVHDKNDNNYIIASFDKILDMYNCIDINILKSKDSYFSKTYIEELLLPGWVDKDRQTILYYHIDEDLRLIIGNYDDDELGKCKKELCIGDLITKNIQKYQGVFVITDDLSKDYTCFDNVWNVGNLNILTSRIAIKRENPVPEKKGYLFVILKDIELDKFRELSKDLAECDPTSAIYACHKLEEGKISL